MRTGLSSGLVALVGVAAILGMGNRPIANRPPAFFLSNPDIMDHDRVLAMLSVHGNARFHRSRDLEALFIPLAHAVAILRADTGPAAASRRRRAVAKLAAYDYDAFRAEVAHLADNPALVHEIETYLTSRPPGPSDSRSVIETDVMNIVQGVGPESCRVQAVKLRGQVYPPPPVAWDYDIMVPRNLGDVARAIDPQSWNQCSLLFRNSYLIETPSCCPYSQPRDCSFQTSPGSAEPQPTSPKPRGMPYGYVSFFEEFCAMQDKPECADSCANADCDVSSQNVLCVKTWYDLPASSSLQVPNATRYDVDYYFGRWLFGEFLGDEGYEVTKDEGSLFVRIPTTGELGSVPTGTWSFVHVDKHLEFDSSGTTNAVGNWMMATAVQDELEGQIMEMACCDVEAQPWGVSSTSRIALFVRKIPERFVRKLRAFWAGLLPAN